jgi:hypothetical protein
VIQTTCGSKLLLTASVIRTGEVIYSWSGFFLVGVGHCRTYIAICSGILYHHALHSHFFGCVQFNEKKPRISCFLVTDPCIYQHAARVRMQRHTTRWTKPVKWLCNRALERLQLIGAKPKLALTLCNMPGAQERSQRVLLWIIKRPTVHRHIRVQQSTNQKREKNKSQRGQIDKGKCGV